MLSLRWPRCVEAQEGGDLQAQILYAYQTEDINELGNLMQNLDNQVKAGGADAALATTSRTRNTGSDCLPRRSGARRRPRHSPTASIS